MIRPALRSALLASFLAIASFTVIGCGSKPSGRYEADNGMAGIEFKSGKAYLISAVGQTECDYTISGDKITIKNSGQEMVVTYNKDGTLDTPFGMMHKKS
ncbi:MAG: hypothetical protein ABR964_10370 [Tepidisphaeraceae bacterium]|jgi:hypothetical protein